MKYPSFCIRIGVIAAVCLLCAARLQAQEQDAPGPAREDGGSRSTRLFLAIGSAHPTGAFTLSQPGALHYNFFDQAIDGQSMLIELQVPTSRVVQLIFSAGLTWNPDYHRLDREWREESDEQEREGWYSAPLVAGLRLSTAVGGGVSFSLLGGIGMCILQRSPHSEYSYGAEREYGMGVAVAVSGGVGITFTERFSLELRYLDGGKPDFERRARFDEQEFVSRTAVPVSYTLILMGVRL